MCIRDSRYAMANNRYMPGFDASKPESYILYIDANNLYGKAMSYALPVGGFEWRSDLTIDDVLKCDWSDSVGCFVEVDLSYPEHLHDLHNDLPLAPEKVELGYEDASDTSRARRSHAGAAGEKLCGHFRPRFHYVCDARAL